MDDMDLPPSDSSEDYEPEDEERESDAAFAHVGLPDRVSIKAAPEPADYDRIPDSSSAGQDFGSGLKPGDRASTEEAAGSKPAAVCLDRQHEVPASRPAAAEKLASDLEHMSIGVQLR